MHGLRPRAMSAVPRLVEGLVDEETNPGYSSIDFYPAHPSQILNDRFKILTKLGWGSSSTVWLAEDVLRARGTCNLIVDNKLPRYVTVKIGTRDNHGIKTELELSRHIASANPSHPGAKFIRTVIDEFSTQGSRGTHGCLVYTPMRETLYDLMWRFKGNKLPPQLLKLYLNLLLQTLDYLHQECRMIHTGQPRKPLSP